MISARCVARARATWACVLETVCDAVRRLSKISNSAFECDYYHYYYLICQKNAPLPLSSVSSFCSRRHHSAHKSPQKLCPVSQLSFTAPVLVRLSTHRSWPLRVKCLPLHYSTPNFHQAVNVVVCWCSPPSPSPTPLPLTGGSKNAPLAAEELKTPQSTVPVLPPFLSAILHTSDWFPLPSLHHPEIPPPLHIASRLPPFFTSLCDSPSTLRLPLTLGEGVLPPLLPPSPTPPRLPSPTSPWDSPPPHPPSGDSPSLHCFKPPSTSPQDSPSRP